MPKARKKIKRNAKTQKNRISLSSQDSYKSLLYGIATVIILFIIGFGAVKLFVNRPKPEIDSQAVSIQNLTIENPSPTAEAMVSEIPTKIPSTIPTRHIRPGEKTYTVKAGDSLWDIAVVQYNDGYKWVQIAKANNLANPSTIFKDDKLIIPHEQITPTPPVATLNSQSQGSLAIGTGTKKITGSSYVIQRGDNLWDIAVRAYGDGYKWIDIASANKLENPGLIFKDNTLKIPR